MSRRSAALPPLLLLAALFVAVDAAAFTLPWIQSNVYQIYAHKVTVAGATRGAFVWVPYFTPPPPPPGWAQTCYIALPTTGINAFYMTTSLINALTYNSTIQQRYGLPPLLMSDAWNQFASTYGEYSQLAQNTAHCSMLRYLQLVYNGTSMGNAIMALNVPATGVLLGALAAGPSPSSMSGPMSVSVCGLKFTGFTILQPGTYYVKLPSGGYVYLVAPNCTTYILAAEYRSYYWNSTYWTWYNGTRYGVAFAVTFSAPCVTYPAAYTRPGINNYLQYGTHVTFCGSTQVTTSTSSYYAYYALLSKNASGMAWYRVNFHGGYYLPNVVVPVPVAVNMTTWSGVRLAFASYNNIYWISPGQDFAAERQPEITFNTTWLQQQPGLLIPQDGGTQQGPSAFLDIFLVDPNNNTNVGLAAFSTYFLPQNAVGSAYVMTDGGSAVFPFLGMLRPLVVYAPAGANVLLFVQINGKTYFTENVACPYTLYTMPNQYFSNVVSFIDASNINSYSVVQIQNVASTPIYIAIFYTVNSLFVSFIYMRIDPNVTATVYGPSGGSAYIFKSLNNMCQGVSSVWYNSNFFANYGGKLLRWDGTTMTVVGVIPSLQMTNLTQQIAQYLTNLTNTLLSAYTKALTNITAALKAAYSVPIPKAPTYVGAFSIVTVQTALNSLKSAPVAAPPGAFPPIRLPPAPLAVAPAVSAAVAIAWAASRRDEDLTATAAVAGIALAIFGVLMTLVYGTGSLSLVALGAIIAAAAAAWRRSSA